MFRKKARYRENNRERLREEAKAYYNEHREEILSKKSDTVDCLYCNCKIVKCKWNIHLQSKKHCKYVKEFENFIEDYNEQKQRNNLYRVQLLDIHNNIDIKYYYKCRQKPPQKPRHKTTPKPTPKTRQKYNTKMK